MHSFRNLLPRHADGETRFWPKSPRSPKSPKSPQSPKSPKSPKHSRSSQSPKLSRTRENYDHLHQCEGCDNIDDFIRYNTAQQKVGLKERPFAVLHNSFSELDQCAQTCDICRVFRQSLVLEQITFDGLRQLEKTQGQVIVSLHETTTAEGAFKIYLNIALEDQRMRPGVIELNSKEVIGHLALRSDGLDTTVIEQAKGWLNTCRNRHTGKCDNLRWSRENPRLLIEIMSSTSIRLCENQEGDYVALSYCWGDSESRSKEEDEVVMQGTTVMANLDRRRRPFPTSSLPTTVCQSLRIVHAMGIRYAWIDALCIVQDDRVDGKPKGVETMHKVYSNALFTLCACATTGATKELLGQREAWVRKTEPCRLGGRWLTTTDMSLNELRLRSPLADRAWTLQEERLSPRILYVSSNRMYWSCAWGHEMEMKPTYPQPNNHTLQRPVYADSDRRTNMPQAQEFLVACYDGESNLHPYWADIVKSYASRDMGKLVDRLTALSGLAAKYLSTSSHDEYLAGLWANNLAEGLGWQVKQAVQGGFRDVSPSWPSWSWAVLPLQTEIDTNVKCTRSPYFQRIRHNHNQAVESRVDVEGAIKRGQDVKQICVKGRIRELWKRSSRRSEWSTLSTFVNGEERFSFAVNPGQNTHAVETTSGRVLVYEDRKREVISQLDFETDVKRMRSDQVSLWAFEIGVSTMLLLEHCGGGKWRRVGVAWNIRGDYFASAQCETLYLR
jgi:hypothetical protein